MEETTKQKIIHKLTSRKFWVALIAFITAILTAFQVPEASTAQVTAIIMAFGSLIAYIFAEGWTDTANAKSEEHLYSETYTVREDNGDVKNRDSN